MNNVYVLLWNNNATSLHISRRRQTKRNTLTVCGTWLYTLPPLTTPLSAVTRHVTRTSIVRCVGVEWMNRTLIWVTHSCVVCCCCCIVVVEMYTLERGVKTVNVIIQDKIHAQTHPHTHFHTHLHTHIHSCHVTCKHSQTCRYALH